MNPVTFTDVLSEPSAVAPEYVTRSGKLFACGDYPDKDFSMSAEELAAAVAAFQPCPVDLEHTPTVLSNKLGRVESVSLADDGNSLHGTVTLPKWLDDALGDTERKVSATWDRATKTLQGLALVLSPRVADAALMSAYADFAARHDTPEGRQVLQELHNTSARGGAVCSKSNATMASSHEASTIQKIHDMATEHGAACSSTKSGGSSFPSMYSAAPATNTATTTPQEGKHMSNWDRFVAAISGMKDEDAGGTQAPAGDGASAIAAPVVTLSASAAELEAERKRADAATQRADALAARNIQVESERIMERAVSFADRMLAETKALPAEREFIIADYVQRATDDNLYGVVKFAEGKSTTRVGLLEAQFAARSPHKLTAAEITPALFSILQGHRETPAQDAGDRLATGDELRKLIGMTATGQTHLSTANRSAPSAPGTNGKA
jgi:hypothetical protein